MRWQLSPPAVSPHSVMPELGSGPLKAALKEYQAAMQSEMLRCERERLLTHKHLTNAFEKEREEREARVMSMEAEVDRLQAMVVEQERLIQGKDAIIHKNTNRHALRETI